MSTAEIFKTLNFIAAIWIAINVAHIARSIQLFLHRKRIINHAVRRSVYERLKGNYSAKKEAWRLDQILKTNFNEMHFKIWRDLDSFYPPKLIKDLEGKKV